MKPTRCPGAPCAEPCNQGRACPARYVRDVEADHRMLLFVYALAAVAAAAASAIWPRWW